MAKTIVQRIGLEGGQDVKKELEGIGKAGAEAFKKIQDAAKANNALANFGPALASIKAKAAEVGAAATKLGTEFSTLGDRVQSSVTKVGVLGAAVVAAVAGLATLVTTSAAANDKLNDQAQAAGATARELHNLHGAAKLAGVEQDELQAALNKVAKAADQSVKSDIELANKKKTLNRELALGRISLADYNKQLQDHQFQASLSSNAMDRLNISTTNADGSQKNQITILKDVADALQDMPPGFEKSALAMEFFGRSGTKLNNLMKDGRAGIESYEREVERLSPLLEDRAVQAAGKADDAFDQLKATIKSSKDAFLQFFFPLQSGLFTALTEALAANRIQIIVLGSALADKVKPIIQDIIALLQGGQATKGGLVDRTIDAFTRLQTSADQTINGILIPAFNAFMAVCGTVAETLNGIFGTDLSAGALAFTAVLLKLTGTFGVIGSAIRVVIAGVGLLAATIGLLPAVIAVIAAAFALWLFNAAGGIKGLQTAWTTVWTAITTFFTNNVITPLQNAWTGFINFVATVFNGLVGIVTAIGAGIVAAWSAVVEGVKAVWNALVQFFVDLGTGIVTAVETIWNSIVAKAKACVDAVKAAFSSGLKGIGDFFAQLEQKVIGIFDAIIRKAKELIGVSKEAGSAAAGAGGGGDEPGFASGGYVRGRGTGTSDSIWARLSNGEFVQRWAAVQKFGLGFMQAVNRGDTATALRALLNNVRGANLGGFADAVSSAVSPGNRFAAGGLVMAGGDAMGGSGGRPFHLHFPGGEMVGGLSASAGAIDQITRLASKASVKSAGRKPTWQG
jgi:hypothetical protein